MVSYLVILTCSQIRIAHPEAGAFSRVILIFCEARLLHHAEEDIVRQIWTVGCIGHRVVEVSVILILIAVAMDIVHHVLTLIESDARGRPHPFHPSQSAYSISANLP